MTAPYSWIDTLPLPALGGSEHIFSDFFACGSPHMYSNYQGNPETPGGKESVYYTQPDMPEQVR